LIVSVRGYGFLFDGCWEAIGTIAAFYEANHS
jgi:ADP-glucose pyrophosphorylase